MNDSSPPIFRPSRHRRAVVAVDWRDAEELAAWHMAHALGFTDARTTRSGPDGGLDVVSEEAVAQVKHHEQPTGAPEVQDLRGAAHGRRYAIFYSLHGYTSAARRFANESGCALFSYDIYGDVRPDNSTANQLLNRPQLDLFDDPRTESAAEFGKKTAEAKYEELRAEAFDPPTTGLDAQRLSEHWSVVCERSHRLEVLAGALYSEVAAENRMITRPSRPIPRVRELRAGAEVEPAGGLNRYIEEEARAVTELSGSIDLFEESSSIRGWYERLDALRSTYSELQTVWNEVKTAEPDEDGRRASREPTPRSIRTRLLEIEWREQKEMRKVKKEARKRRREAKAEADMRPREAEAEADMRRREAATAHFHRVLAEISATGAPAPFTDEDQVEELHRLRHNFAELHNLAVSLAGRWQRNRGEGTPEPLLDLYIEAYRLSKRVSAASLPANERLEEIVKKRESIVEMTKKLEEYERQLDQGSSAGVIEPNGERSDGLTKS